MKFSFMSYLTKADGFGHKFELHYKGSTQFQTAIGGCATIILYILVSINAINILSDFINDENQKEVHRIISANYDDLGEVALLDQGVIIQVSSPTIFNNIKPEIGRMQYWQETSEILDTLESKKDPLDFGSCDD